MMVVAMVVVVVAAVDVVIVVVVMVMVVEFELSAAAEAVPQLLGSVLDFRENGFLGIRRAMGGAYFMLPARSPAATGRHV